MASKDQWLVQARKDKQEWGRRKTDLKGQLESMTAEAVSLRADCARLEDVVKERDIELIRLRRSVRK
jgi:hypothetical protein